LARQGAEYGLVSKLSSVLSLTGALMLCGSAAWSAEGIIAKFPDPTSKYCHLKFPAILIFEVSSIYSAVGKIVASIPLLHYNYQS
jgi:hypothetical protein